MKLRITVRDTGPGIPEIEQHVIFDAFRQVDGSSTRSHGGLGVGLSTAKRLAGLMKAELKLEETSTEGSTFSLSWESPLDTTPVSHVDLVKLNQISDTRLVIIDHSETGRELIARNLSRYFTTIEAFPAFSDELEEIVMRSEENCPDLILVDPEGDSAVISKLSAQPELRFMVLSADASPGVAQRFKEAKRGAAYQNRLSATRFFLSSESCFLRKTTLVISSPNTRRGSSSYAQSVSSSSPPNPITTKDLVYRFNRLA